MVDFMDLNKIGTQGSPMFHPYPTTQLFHHDIKLVETLNEDITQVELSSDDKLHADACDDMFPDELLDEEMEKEVEEEFAGVDQAEREELYQIYLQHEANRKLREKQSAPVATSSRKNDEAEKYKKFEMKEMGEELYKLTPKSLEWLDADFLGYGPPAPLVVLTRDERPTQDQIDRARNPSYQLPLYVKVRKHAPVQVASQKRGCSVVQEEERSSGQGCSSGFKAPTGVPPRRPGGKKGRKLPPNESRG